MLPEPSVPLVDDAATLPLKEACEQLNFGVDCEPCGTRTHDPLIKSQVLYHLS